MFKIFGLRQALASGVRHAASHQRGVVFSEKFASEFAKCAITSVTWRDNATKAESSSYIPRTRFWISTESNRVSPSLRLRSSIIPSFMYMYCRFLLYELIRYLWFKHIPPTNTRDPTCRQNLTAERGRIEPSCLACFPSLTTCPAPHTYVCIWYLGGKVILRFAVAVADNRRAPPPSPF